MPPPIKLLLVNAGQHGWRLRESLTSGRFLMQTAGLADAESRIRDFDPDAVLVFIEVCREDLPVLVKRWKAIRPRIQFFLFPDHPPTTRGLVSLMHAGFQDVIERPAEVDPAAVLDSIEERIRFVRVHQIERLRAKQSIHYTGLVGESPEMLRTYEAMLRAASLNCPVLVQGETGTGKGLVAHAIHALSRRNTRPFVTVDCACLAPTLIESELYGVTRGAYTGATSDRSGLVQAAQQGTLFLDEIGELPVEMQPKLLRLLEERQVRRLGSHQSTSVDVRVIAATSRQLESLIAAEQFRPDLYYRLNVLSIELAPLRQRPQDIPVLARHFASSHTIEGREVILSEEAINELMEYHWPGNVRELKNWIEAAIASASSNIIQPKDLPRRSGLTARRAVESPESLNLKQLEQQAILRALEITRWDKVRAARLLGIGKSTLYRRLKEMEASSPRLRRPQHPYVM
jgi:DNA-binding NtrC family response regulator